MSLPGQAVSWSYANFSAMVRFLLIALIALACKSEVKVSSLVESAPTGPAYGLVDTSTGNTIDIEHDQELVEGQESVGDQAPIKQEPSAQESPPKQVRERAGHPKITFEEISADFGELVAGEKTSHTFSFTNTGKAALEIKNVHVSCGCTFPSYPFLAIAPGESGTIGLTYNSVGKKGYQTATARVISSDPENREVVLTLTGTVLEE